MDYKQKYEEALENIKKIKTANKDNKELVDFIEFEYPELKDSKDERIRKELIEYLKTRLRTSFNQEVRICKDGIAYLEKQGEQNPTNKFEPKFKAGDYIINEHGFIMQIDGIDNNTYIYHVLDNTDEKLTYDINKTDKSCHLWTIQDAKPGDILVDNYGNIVIYQEPSTKLMYHSYCYGNKTHFIDTGGSHSISNTYPATKNQCDFLFQKIRETGYEWNPEKKELNKIKQISNWNEEDEKISNAIYQSIDFLCLDFSEDKVRDWLKSIKERIKLAPCTDY